MAISCVVAIECASHIECDVHIEAMVNNRGKELTMADALTCALSMLTDQPALGGPLRVRLTLTNASDADVAIVNPDVGTPQPTLQWPASHDAYRFATLMSYNIIALALTRTEPDTASNAEASARPVKSTGLNPWITPVLGTRTLPPGASVTLDFDLSELFELDKPGRHTLTAKYTDESGTAECHTHIDIRGTDVGLG